MRDRLDEFLRSALWWVGWRPLLVTVAGATVGVVVGAVFGSLGAGAGAFGFVLAAVSLLDRTLRKLYLAVVGFGFGTFFVVGGERLGSLFGETGRLFAEVVSGAIVNIARDAGFLSPTVQDEYDNVTTGTGGELIVESDAAVEIVGGALASLALWSVMGAVFGMFVWLAGVYWINASHGLMRDGFVEEVRERGEELLGDDLYTLTHGRGELPLVDAPYEYHTSNVAVGETSVKIHHGSVLDSVTRESDVSDNAKSLYYDQVASVDYDEPFLRIGMSDGDVIEIVGTEVPDEMVERIRGNVQEYKT